MKLILTVITAGLLTACAADPVKVQQVAEDEASRLPSPTRPLSDFAEFTLEAMTFSDAIQREDRKMAEAREFEANLIAKLAPLLDKWNAADRVGANGKLAIQPRLERLKIISGGSRFWIGAMAGDSFIGMDLVLADADTGEVVADVRVHRTANSTTGAWSVGKSDQNLDDYVVSIISEYLSNSY